MHPDGEAIRKLYDAFSNADLETIRNSIADDGVLEFAGQGGLAGTYKGKDEILGVLGELVSRTEGTFKAQVHDVLANDEHVVVLSDISATKGGTTISERGVEIFHMADGKIKEAWFTGMDPSALQKLLDA